MPKNDRQLISIINWGAGSLIAVDAGGFLWLGSNSTDPQGRMYLKWAELNTPTLKPTDVDNHEKLHSAVTSSNKK